MSTYYYRLHEPITSLRVKKQGSHNKIIVWVNHGLVGELVVRNEETVTILQLFRRKVHSLYLYFDGKTKGLRLMMTEEGLSDNECLVSEIGEVCTLADVKRGIRGIDKAWKDA